MTDTSELKAMGTQDKHLSVCETEEFVSLPDFMADSVRSLQQQLGSLRDSLNFRFSAPLSQLGDLFRVWADVLQGSVKNEPAKDALRRQRILPHKSTPWHLFNPDKPDLFAESVLSYYSAEWDHAQTVFLTDLEAYHIDEDVKEAFAEAIKCHTSKLYGAAVLTAFSAAEAAYRRGFEIAPGTASTSLRELISGIGHSPPDILCDHVAPFDLYKILRRHLYERIGTEEDIKRFANDPIPNRHAAIHGIIQYRSELNSLNALIIADYALFMISQIFDHQVVVSDP